MNILRFQNSKLLQLLPPLNSKCSAHRVRNFGSTVPRCHWLTPQNRVNTSDMKTPDLVYFPQVMRWVKTKIGFKVLQKAWDPEFSEGAFIYGSTQAICRITEAIGTEDKNNDLQDLVTPRLWKKLHTDIHANLSEIQKQIIVLKPKDIKLLIPIEVKLHQQEDRRQCSVLLRTLAIKWHDFNGTIRLAIIALQSEFIRDYSQHTLKTSDNGWTVRLFDILECNIAGEVKGAPRKK